MPEIQCIQELSNSDKAKGMDTKELLANIFCAIKDVATAIREKNFFFRRKAMEDFDIVQDEGGNYVNVGVPFVPIGYISDDDSVGGATMYRIDPTTWRGYLIGEYDVDAKFRVAKI